MNDEETPIDAQEPVDVSAALAETMKTALQVLFPSPKELTRRLPLITSLTGKAPNMNKLFAAIVEMEGWDSLIEKRPFDQSRTDLRWLLAHAVSLSRGGRKEAVDMARAHPASERKRSLFEVLKGD